MNSLFFTVAKIQGRHNNIMHHLIWIIFFVGLDNVVCQVKC